MRMVSWSLRQYPACSWTDPLKKTYSQFLCFSSFEVLNLQLCPLWNVFRSFSSSIGSCFEYQVCSRGVKPSVLCWTFRVHRSTFSCSGHVLVLCLCPPCLYLPLFIHVLFFPSWHDPITELAGGDLPLLLLSSSAPGLAFYLSSTFTLLLHLALFFTAHPLFISPIHPCHGALVTCLAVALATCIQAILCWNPWETLLNPCRSPEGRGGGRVQTQLWWSVTACSFWTSCLFIRTQKQLQTSAFSFFSWT